MERFKRNKGCGWRHSAALVELVPQTADLAVSGLLWYTTVFFAIALAGQRRFQAALFSGWNIEGMSFNFADNIFLLHFALKPAERAFERLVIAEFDFCHLLFTCLSTNAIECSTPA